MQRLGNEFITDHFVHVRCEITSDLHDLFEVIESPLVKLISLMDHTPGQGQFTDHGKYREYHKKIYDLDDVEINVIIKKKSANKGNKGYILQKMRDVSKRAHARRIPVASHDDDNTQNVELVYNIGVRILEFPITLDAAKKGHELGMTICMGAPNVVLAEQMGIPMVTITIVNGNIVYTKGNVM